jgi:UDP-GlcNAc:undecaprenyl-phosphate GlcNAc-1-phosphate transferase
VIIALIVHEMGLSIDKFQLPFTGLIVDIPIVSYFVTVVWIVAMMNLINLIDGLDGLAGGIGLLLMLMLAYLGFEAAIPFSSILALGAAGALIGFLFHNFPPAKVYLGDSGAYAVGFVIAALAIINSQKGTVLAALIAPVLALALPIADVAFAILRRGLKGLPVFRPDRQHIHHRLIRSGLSHRGTVLVLYGISAFALVGGLLVFAKQGRYLPIFLGFAFAIILIALRGQKLTVSGALKNVVGNSLGLRQDTRNALFLRDWLIAETERADSGKNLWSDYKFVLKKMGFCRAELTLGEETREFYVPNTPHEDPDKLVVETVTFRTSIPAVLKLYAEREKFSDAQFELLADLAAEAWTRAMNKWKAVNGEVLSFDAEASGKGDYRARKMRSLYRPTY